MIILIIIIIIRPMALTFFPLQQYTYINIIIIVGNDKYNEKYNVMNDNNIIDNNNKN